MKVKFADTFASSLKRLADGENPWHWRYWNYRFYDVKWFFKNLPGFMKMAWKYRPWNFDLEHHEFLKFHLPNVRSSIANGHEAEHSRDKKVHDIEKCIRVNKRLIDDNYHDIAFRCLPKSDRDAYEDISLADMMNGLERDEASSEIQSRFIGKAWDMQKNDYKVLFEMIHDRGPGWWD